jgi:hypothetical protein
MKFFRNCALFSLPIIVGVAFPVWLGWYSGEFDSLAHVIGAQKKGVLFGLQYNAVDLPYKQALIAARDPEVLVLGTSRVLEFEKDFFTNPSGFLNAGKAVEHAEDYLTALNALSSIAQTKLIIVALDPDIFKTTPSARNPLAPTSLDRLRAFFVQKQWLTAYRQFFPTKKIFSDLRARKQSTGDIGVNALEFKEGYLPDGSYLFGRTIQNPNRLQLFEEANKTEVALIQNTPQEFEYAATPDPEKLSLAASLLLDLVQRFRIQSMTRLRRVLMNTVKRCGHCRKHLSQCLESSGIPILIIPTRVLPVSPQLSLLINVT